MKNRLKKSLIKFATLMLIVAMSLLPMGAFANDGSWIGKTLDFLFGETKEAMAAPDSSYSFIIGNKEVNDGQIIDYSLYNNADKTLTIILRCIDGIEQGSVIYWEPSNKNVITVESQNDATCSVTLNIISPGFSGLYVTIKTPAGVTYTAIAYCDIYVPLQWSDNVSATDPTMNNILASDANGNYGLLNASTEDPEYTLQLYTSNSADHPNSNHYLRKLKYVSYKYTSGSGKTGNVTSDVEASELGDFTAALEWSSSDPSVATVDTLTGLVTAVSAGFATISVRTSTENEKQGEGDVLSYNLVVVPEGYVSGYTTDMKTDDVVRVSGKENEVVLQTNATFANTLKWRVFKGDFASKSNEITDTLEKQMEIGEANGRVVFSDLDSGVYFVTAIPIKNEEAAKLSPTYDITQALIKSLQYVIVVPLNYPSGPIVLSYYNGGIYDSYDLIANSNIPPGLFRFYSDNVHTAAVGMDNGVIDATGEGDATIKLSLYSRQRLESVYGSYADDMAMIGYDGTDKTIDVTVNDGIAINTGNATLTVGSTMQLSLTAPSPYQGDIDWSSNDTSIATVDESGLVTAKKVGTARITCKIKVGNGIIKRAQCTVKVIATVDDIKLSAKTDYVNVGENLTISANVNPKIADTQLVFRVSDESIASIESVSPLAITIKGEKVGTVVVTAVNSDNAIVGTMIIKVVQKIESITLSDTSVTISQSAGFYQLYATCQPELPENEKLEWKSSDKKIVTVDENGKVYIGKPGKAVVTVITSNGKSASCDFVVLQGVSSIDFDDTALTMFVGESYRMTYVVKPSDASNVVLKWSTSDTKIATVDATGYITAKNTGSCVITAQATDGSGVFSTCTVTVLRNASDIKLDVTTLDLNVGEAYQLDVELKPADATDVLLFESSNAKIATVSKKGKVVGASKGSCIIFAKTESGLSTYCTVNVTQQVTGIKLNKTDLDMMVGDEFALVATITPKNADDQEVTWSSSDKNVAAVDPKGVVTAYQGGSTIITCISDDGDYLAYCLVNVEERIVSISVEENVEIKVGQKLKLNAVVSNATATNQALTWSTSKKKVCTVTKKGVIKGVKAGKAIITVAAADGSDAFAECEVRVINPTDSITLSTSYIELMQGKTKKVTATVSPKNATYKPVWSSSNEKVAIVNKNGKITALNPGECMIYATAGDDENVKSVVYVKVYAPVNASNVSFAEDEIVMVSGETTAVQYSITPSNFTESFSWSSDNPSVASVDSNGRITAKAVGTANITLMTKSGKKGVLKVFVVGLSKSRITLHQYESTIINLQVDGVGAKELTVRWDTNEQGIATIANGKVTGRAKGSTIVYAVVNGRHLACTVKVIPN